MAVAPLMAAVPLKANVAKRTTMGLAADSFQSIRFSSPHRLLEVDR
jgi:hypothetical protein